MTKTELKRKPVTCLRQIAHYMGLVIPRDFTKQDIFETICDRLGSPEENRVGWKLLDQYE